MTGDNNPLCREAELRFHPRILESPAGISVRGLPRRFVPARDDDNDEVSLPVRLVCRTTRLSKIAKYLGKSRILAYYCMKEALLCPR